MDIDRLKKKRQLNVQEQITLKKDVMQKAAKCWREIGIPEGIKILLERHGIDSSHCILLNYQQDFPGCSTDFGNVVSKEKRIYEFDVDLSSDRKTLIETFEWKEITNEFEVNSHKPGIGATWAYLAFEILDEFNKS